MTIAAEDLVKIHELVVEPVLDFTKSFPVSKEGDLVPEQMTLLKALRGENKAEIDATGVSSYTLDFASYNVIVATIDETCVFTLSNLVEGDSVYLKVEKGLTHLVSFYYVDNVNKFNQNQTMLLFHIIKKDGVVHIDNINRVKPISLSSAKFTPSAGTIVSFDYFKSTIIDNLVLFEGKFTYVGTGSSNSILISIADWPIVKYNAAVTPIVATCLQSAAYFRCDALMDESNLKIYFDSRAIDVNITITISGHFEIV